MIAINHAWGYELGLVITFMAMAYAVVAGWATGRRTQSVLAHPGRGCLPKVTVLKPLCGAEIGTYECLRSICDQDYPDFQVIFGVSRPDDPSVVIARRLQREFPERGVQIVIDRRQHGSNPKVSNLINMMPLARNDVLVLSDSDVRVTRDYLAQVVAPLSVDGVGIVTCAYRGRAGTGIWSLLGALFINEWFLPSVCVAAAAGSRSFAFGATIAIRQQVLHRIGGFYAIADQLADDYRLGELTRQLGLRTVLSNIIVETSVVERSFQALVRHELRWLRTIRALRPYGYCFCFITFGTPVALLGTLLAGAAPAALGMLALTAAVRLVLHLRMTPRGSRASQLMLVPLRDLLSVCLWLWSFASRRVQWRDDRYRVGRDGSVQLVARV